MFVQSHFQRTRHQSGTVASGQHKGAHQHQHHHHNNQPNHSSQSHHHDQNQGHSQHKKQDRHEHAQRSNSQSNNSGHLLNQPQTLQKKSYCSSNVSQEKGRHHRTSINQHSQQHHKRGSSAPETSIEVGDRLGVVNREKARSGPSSTRAVADREFLFEDLIKCLGDFEPEPELIRESCNEVVRSSRQLRISSDRKPINYHRLAEKNFFSLDTQTAHETRGQIQRQASSTNQFMSLTVEAEANLYNSVAFVRPSEEPLDSPAAPELANCSLTSELNRPLPTRGFVDKSTATDQQFVIGSADDCERELYSRWPRRLQLWLIRYLQKLRFDSAGPGQEACNYKREDCPPGAKTQLHNRLTSLVASFKRKFNFFLLFLSNFILYQSETWRLMLIESLSTNMIVRGTDHDVGLVTCYAGAASAAGSSHPISTTTIESSKRQTMSKFRGYSSSNYADEIISESSMHRHGDDLLTGRDYYQSHQQQHQRRHVYHNPSQASFECNNNPMGLVGSGVESESLGDDEHRFVNHVHRHNHTSLEMAKCAADLNDYPPSTFSPSLAGSGGRSPTIGLPLLTPTPSPPPHPLLLDRRSLSSRGPKDNYAGYSGAGPLLEQVSGSAEPAMYATSRPPVSDTSWQWHMRHTVDGSPVRTNPSRQHLLAKQSTTSYMGAATGNQTLLANSNQWTATANSMGANSGGYAGMRRTSLSSPTLVEMGPLGEPPSKWPESSTRTLARMQRDFGQHSAMGNAADWQLGYATDNVPSGDRFGAGGRHVQMMPRAEVSSDSGRLLVHRAPVMAVGGRTARHSSRFVFSSSCDTDDEGEEEGGNMISGDTGRNSLYHQHQQQQFQALRTSPYQDIAHSGPAAPSAAATRSLAGRRLLKQPSLHVQNSSFSGRSSPDASSQDCPTSRYNEHPASGDETSRAHKKQVHKQQQHSNGTSSVSGDKGGPGGSNSKKASTNQGHSSTGGGTGGVSLPRVSLAGAKKRLGFKRKDGRLSSLSVHRSEEVFPVDTPHCQHPVRCATTFDSSSTAATSTAPAEAAGGLGHFNESIWDLDQMINSSKLWLGQYIKNAPETKASFVDGLGAGQIASRQALVSPYLGDIQLGLSDRRGMLEVEVIRVRQLQPKACAKRLPSPYVKVYLMREKKCLAKFKTSQANQTLDPLFQQRFIFRDDYSNCVLQVIVWGEYGKKDKKSLMGVVQIFINDLDMSSLVIGWYKLFNVCSMTNSSLIASSKALRQTILSAKLSSDQQVSSNAISVAATTSAGADDKQDHHKCVQQRQ